MGVIPPKSTGFLCEEPFSPTPTFLDPGTARGRRPKLEENPSDVDSEGSQCRGGFYRLI